MASYTINVTDYRPFGMLMPGRTESSSEYRYGYQGSEKDDEVSGSGNLYSTHFRLLDPRIGRWFSIDPKASTMPWQSPYNSMDDNPIRFNDQYGDAVLNGVRKTVEEKENDFDIANEKFEEMKSNHSGELSAKTLRTFKKESGLKDAENSLAYWKKIEKGIDEMICTFSEVMPEEFDFLNSKLFDTNGNEIDVIVNYNDNISPKGETNPASTFIPLATAGYSSSDGGATAYWTGDFIGNINISIFKNGMSTKWLANEFGDVDYVFKLVVPGDSESFNRWRTTGNSGSSGYRSPGGAGDYSEDYQYKFQAAFRLYTKDMSKDEVDNLNYIIK